MRIESCLMAAAHVVGGLSLFIYGMHVMTGGLRAAAGSSLRTVLGRATDRRMKALAMGVALGFLAHSGAATTMLAGFVNAGLMSLSQSVVPILGANVGTALSMQLISFKIGHFCWIAIALGFIFRALVRNDRGREIGSAILGFGLIFLGMTTIGDALMPHRDALVPWIARLGGQTFGSRIAAICVSAALTALLTSSGAMIGLCFALISAGVLTDFDHVFPIVMGAHIGTCVVALTASVSMNVEARRSAAAHLAFNVFNVALALAVYPPFKTLILASSPDLARQAANLHIAAMAGAALVVLPIAPLFAKLMRVIVPSNKPLPEASHLKPDLIEAPEQALYATLQELRRMARICVDSMMINGEMILTPKASLMRRITANEEVIDEVKDAIGDYLSRLALHYLSRRQTLFLQHLDRCMKDIERIGDHLAALGETSRERLRHPEAILPEEIFKSWFDLFCAAKQVLVLMERSLDPENPDFQQAALEILKARDRYIIMSMDAKADFAGAVENRQISPLGGYYLNRYTADLDRMVRHAKTIAFAQRQPEFRVNRSKLLHNTLTVRNSPPAPVDPKDYLAQLRRDNLLDETEDDIDMGIRPGD